MYIGGLLQIGKNKIINISQQKQQECYVRGSHTITVKWIPIFPNIIPSDIHINTNCKLWSLQLVLYLITNFLPFEGYV